MRVRKNGGQKYEKEILFFATSDADLLRFMFYGGPHPPSPLLIGLRLGALTPPEGLVSVLPAAMPLTLDEIKSLVAALGGQKSPKKSWRRRPRPRSSRARREKIAAEAGGKPADWRLKSNLRRHAQGAPAEFRRPNSNSTSALKTAR